MSQLILGHLATDFSLQDHTGSIFTLSQALIKRPVILIFYTMDGSPTCNRLLCGINNELSLFERHGYHLVGVNHSEPDAHSRTAERKHLHMPLLSDTDYRVARAYDSLFEIGPIKAIRYSAVGIGQDSRIKYIEHGRPSNENILRGMAAGLA